VQLPGTLLGEFSQLIPIRMIIGIGSEGKKVRDAVVAQFELRAAFQVAGEQAEGDVGAGLKGLEERKDSWKQAARALGEQGGEVAEVSVQKAFDIFLMNGNSVAREQTQGDSGIRTAWDFD
jgi:uncharacterized protein with GYD domain